MLPKIHKLKSCQLTVIRMDLVNRKRRKKCQVHKAWEKSKWFETLQKIQLSLNMLLKF